MKPVHLLGIVLLLTISTQFPSVKSSNILFFFGVSTFSHKLLVWPLAETLANRGHNVTFLSPYPSIHPNPKIHEFSPVELQEFFSHAFGPKSNFLSIRLKNGQQDAWHQMLPVLATTVCEIILQSPESLEWIKSNKFDMVVIDALFNDCGLGLAWKFGAQHAIFGTCTMFMWQPDNYGFQPETSYIPDASMDFPMEMNFKQRVSNTIRPVLWHLYRNYVMYPQLEAQFNKAFNLSKEQRMPSLVDISKNASLVLQNMHYSLDYPRSVPPLVIPVGGLHLAGNSSFESVSNEMADFMNTSGEKGFIYVSFGSVVQISKMPNEMRQEFIHTFRNYSSLRFLWKYERSEDDPEANEKLPPNVFTSKWMPQQKILAHPNIKGFISHGGILSVEEAVYNKVPMIIMPVFADQEFNSENVIRRGMGLRIHFKDVNQTILTHAISEITSNIRFKEAVAEVSQVFQNRPIPPMEEAIWWVEYTLKNPKAAKYLRPWAGSGLNWIQRRHIDVWAFVGIAALTCVIFMMSFTLFSIKLIYKLFFKKQQSNNNIPRRRSNNNESPMKPKKFE